MNDNYDSNGPPALTKYTSMRSLADQYSLPPDFLRTGAYHNNPTPADKGKPMYYNNGFFIGHFQGIENTNAGPKATFSRNEESLGPGWNPQYVYVQNAPLNGGKSRRRTKKTIRGKSKRRGKKTRGQRR